MPTKPVGDSGARVAFVGEAPGEQEDLLGCPFIGTSGQLLASMIVDAGLDPRPAPRGPLEMINWWRASPFHVTNVFHERPPRNDLDAWLVPKADAAPFIPALRPGKYLPRHRAHVLSDLARELSEMPALNLIVALGATATWALIGQTKISKLRGFVYPATLVPGLKVLATFHPAAVLRNWELRVQVVTDLMKVPGESMSRDIRKTDREVILEPTLSEIKSYLDGLTNDVLSFDIETGGGQITCIGFAQTPTRAIVIPFVDWRKPGGSYWQSQFEEANAWALVRAILQHPCPKLAQNGLYDIQWLWRKMGIPVRNYCHDSMLLHHSLQPELPKGLGWLGSVHASGIGNWKSMRHTHQSETKREE